MTAYELSEIHEMETVYTIGSYRVSHLSPANDGTYRAHVGEQFLYRYIVERVCGKGAFG